MDEPIQTVLIAAVARNGVIGRQNDLPFRLKSDLKRFKALTLGHPVLMGRLTYQSIGRPLPGRPNLVVSGDREFSAPGCEVYQDLELSVERAKLLADGLSKKAIFILGGGRIYQQSIGMADRLEITHVQAEPEGDVYFPTIEPDVWKIIAEQAQAAQEGDEADMIFRTYQRLKSH
ncbi:MAG: dihydrofolate reductase [Pseudomonadota bacterium]